MNLFSFKTSPLIALLFLLHRHQFVSAHWICYECSSKGSSKGCSIDLRDASEMDCPKSANGCLTIVYWTGIIERRCWLDDDARLKGVQILPDKCVSYNDPSLIGDGSDGKSNALITVCACKGPLCNSKGKVALGSSGKNSSSQNRSGFFPIFTVIISLLIILFSSVAVCIRG